MTEYQAGILLLIFGFVALGFTFFGMYRVFSEPAFIFTGLTVGIILLVGAAALLKESDQVTRLTEQTKKMKEQGCTLEEDKDWGRIWICRKL